MKILSLDSTADVGTVALCEDEKLLAEMTVNTGNTHSESLLPTVEAVLKITGSTINDIDLFACSTGPGSFTGLRIGIGTVKGLAYGLGKKVVGVSTLEALATNLAFGENKIIIPVMDARRGQFYTAKFSFKKGKLERISDDMAQSFEDFFEDFAQKMAKFLF